MAHTPLHRDENSLPNSQHEYRDVGARQYDEKRITDLKWQREDDAVRLLLHSVDTPSSNILDAPVGTGRFLHLYSDSGASCVGVDVSADMLGVAQNRAAELPAMDLTLLQSDIRAMPFEEGSFDVTVCVRLLNLIPLRTVADVVREVSRTTDGHVIIGVRTYDALAASYQALSRLRHQAWRGRHKLHIHPERAIRKLFATHGLVESRAIEIHRGAHRSSVYRIYLLGTSNEKRFQ